MFWRAAAWPQPAAKCIPTKSFAHIRERFRTEEERRLAELRDLEQRNAEARERERQEASEREERRRRERWRSQELLEQLARERDEKAAWEAEKRQLLVCVILRENIRILLAGRTHGPGEEAPGLDL